MNPLEQLQEDVNALCLGNPDTALVPFSIFRKQVIQSAQDQAAAAWKIRVPGKVGLACMTLMPSLRVVTPNVPGPQYDISIIVRTFHDPRVNNIGLTAEDVGSMNLRWLDGKLIEGLTQLHGDSGGDALKPNYEFPGMLVYDTTLTGPLPQDISATTLAPSINEAGGLVTLSCADGAATIYYTIDGTMPMPPANQGELTSVAVYNAPFATPPVGTVVRFLAWNRTKLPSDPGQGIIT